MPVCGLERDEARGDAVQVEAVAEAAVGLAGGDREQPAVTVERLDQLDDAVIERLGDAALAAGAEEAVLVG